jgi:hypothetical protein
LRRDSSYSLSCRAYSQRPASVIAAPRVR